MIGKLIRFWGILLEKGIGLAKSQGTQPAEAAGAAGDPDRDGRRKIWQRCLWGFIGLALLWELAIRPLVEAFCPDIPLPPTFLKEVLSLLSLAGI